MKLILSAICLLLFASQAFSETWSCIYFLEDKKNTFTQIRMGNNFLNPVTKVSSQIIYEDENIINLHNTFSPKFPDYFATLLDKNKKMFAQVGLMAGYHTAIIEGKCRVYTD